jgi:hypothetical protein
LLIEPMSGRVKELRRPSIGLPVRVAGRLGVALADVDGRAAPWLVAR